MRNSPLFQLALARVREFYREKEALFWVFVFPLLMTVALGVAFRDRPPDKVRVDVQDGTGADTLVRLLGADARLEVAARDPEDCRQRLRRGRTDVVVVPEEVTPKGDAPPRCELLFDPNRPTSDSGRSAVEAALLRAARPSGAPALEDRPVDEPGGRYIDWFVPGLIGVNLMGGGLWGVGYSIVDMRVRKLLKRFLATPMRKRDFLLSIVLSRMLFVVPEIALLLAFSRWIFGVEVRGSFGSLLALVILGSACFLGLGLLVASRARTQEAAGGLINLVMLPMYLLSGVFFSYERFPEAAQPYLRALPLTALNDAMRAVMIDGASLASQAVPVLTVAAWAAASFALALRFFRWV